MNDTGAINVYLRLNKDQFYKEVNNVPSEVNAASNKITSSFSKIGKAVGAAFSVAAVVSFTKAVTKSTAEIQAADSQFIQTFGELRDSASAAMKAVAEESGIVQTRLQGVGTSIYAFAKTTGMDSAAALGMMKEALQVTADSAAYYDRSLEDTAESLKAFLKGNYANDAALGLSCTETTRNTAANKLYGKSFKNLSEAQKQLTLLQMVKDANAASGALGQAARESDGLENVLGNLKETWNQFLAVVGKPVLKGAVVVIQNVTTALQKMTEAARFAFEELGKLFGVAWEDSASSAAATSAAIAQSVENQELLTEETKRTNKEAERSTASFDKLNVISKTTADEADSDSGSSGPSAAIDALTNTATGAAEEIDNSFKDRFTELYEKSGLKKSIDKIQTAFNKFDWSKPKEDLIEGFKSIGEAGQEAFGLITESAKRMQPAVDKATGELIQGQASLSYGFSTVLAGGFSKASSALNKWIKTDGKVIGEFFDNIQEVAANIADTVGKIFDDIGSTITDWWNGEGESVFSSICDAFFNIGTTLMNVWNQWIKPAWDFIVGVVQSAWDNWLGPVFGKLLSMLTKIGGMVAALWTNILSPFVNWFVGWLAPKIQTAFEVISGVFSTAFKVAGDVASGVMDFFGGLADFLTGLFSGRIVMAFEGLCNSIWGLFEGIWGIVKGIINIIIDCLNALWAGIYTTVSEIVNTLGGIAGAVGSIFGADWSFSMPSRPQLIPHLAGGGLVTAPTLALVGDNSGASAGNPEVVAPLNKLEDMIGGVPKYDTSLLTSILDYLKRIYELFILFRNDPNREYRFIAELDGDPLFDKFVKEVELYKLRHNGALPF